MTRIAPLLAAILCAATPAFAQPVTITVPYSSSRVLPAPPADISPRPYFNRDYLFYGDPWSLNFDPAAAAINASNAIYHRDVPQSINMIRAATLDRTGESMMSHQLKCQARYASYDLTTDTFLGANGIPVACTF